MPVWKDRDMTLIGGHPGGTPEWRVPRAGRRPARSVFAAVFGVAATVLLAGAVVLMLSVSVFSPDHPGRAVSVALVVPQVQEEIALDIVDEVDQRRAAALTADERDVLQAEIVVALGSDGLHDALETLSPEQVAGETAVVGAEVDAIEAQAERSDPQVAGLLTEAADAVPQTSGPDNLIADDETLRNLWVLALVGAALVGVPGLIAGALAMALSVSRARTAVAIGTAALLLVAVLLAPGDWVLETLPAQWAAVPAVTASIGKILGPGVVWTFIAASLVPVFMWWAARSWSVSSDVDADLHRG